jgi:hypothetical protein
MSRKEAAESFNVTYENCCVICAAAGLTGKRGGAPKGRTRRPYVRSASPPKMRKVELVDLIGTGGTSHAKRATDDRIDGALRPGHADTWGLISKEEWPGNLAKKFA